MQNYNSKFKIIFFIITFNFSLLTFNLPKAFAQSYSLSLTPSLTEIIIKPDKSVSQEYKISNNADPLTLTPQVIPMQINRETGEIIGPTNTTTASDGQSWFSLENQDIKLNEPFFLNSGQSLKLILKIDIPEGVDPADYYFHFLLGSSLPPTDQTTATYITGTIGSNILITVSRLGTLNRTAEITEFDIPFLIDTFDNPKLIIKLKNTGSAFLKARGTITLENPLSSTKYNILPQNILTKSSRFIQTTESLKEKHETNSTLTIKKFLFGPQRITSTIKIEGTNIVLTKSSYVLALPYKAILIITLILGIYIFLKSRKLT